MTAISEIANRRGLLVIEDAAQGLGSTYQGRPLGHLGDLAAVSFHETKNVISGEGGALLVNHARWVQRAEILWEKGTNRSQFFRGMVDKYTWVDIGSSYLPSEINAAFLLAQLEMAEDITARRLAVWDRYHDAFAECEGKGVARRPVVSPDCTHNAHLYYLLFENQAHRTAVQGVLRAQGIDAVFHYVPLHSSPAGRRFGRTAGSLTVTERNADRLLRLPLWVGMTDEHIAIVTEAVSHALVQAHA
jgi:dTDP-4-amino-4,6-dideoxygalactose transaminase